MPVSLKDFAKSLAASGLMSADEIRDFLGTLPSEKRPKSTRDLARELIRAGKITKYQAEEVYHGRTKGLVLGNYVLLDKIGAGGMGQVFKAQHGRMKRMVALKVLPAAAMKSEQSVQRFQREVEAAAKLLHPNIVTAFDADEANGVHFLVMEQVDGSDLSHIVNEHGPLPVDTAVDCIIQAARGLEYAHSEGVIHRDIKPANVLIDKKGTVKILDMGLARVFEAEDTPEDRLTDSGQVMGTCDYMAPEQAEDTRTADHRADIYSLGCTLYRIVTGNKPYEGGSLIQILMAHRAAPIPSLGEERPDVPASLEATYQKMMAKTPENRYQSMTEVISDLEACVAKQRQPVTSEASSDSALTSFLQNVSEPGVSTKRKATKAAEETIPSRAELETDKNIWRKIVPIDRRQRKIFVGVAAGSALLVVLFGIVFMLRTPDGTLVVEVKQADAEILVDDKKIKVTSPGEEPVEVEVVEGKHTLRVTKGGFKTFTKEFTIESGGKEVVSVELRPVEKKVAKKVAVKVDEELSVVESPAVAATAKESFTLPNGWSFGEPVNLGPTVNTRFDDVHPALSFDGLTMVFGSDRPGGQGQGDLWMCIRKSVSNPFGEPVNLGPTVNTGSGESGPALSANSLTLFFESNRSPGGLGQTDLWMCARKSVRDFFGEPVNLGPTVNSNCVDDCPSLSADGLMLLFRSDRPGGFGDVDLRDLWMCTRKSVSDSFGEPVNLGPTVNTSGADGHPELSSDGLTLFLSSAGFHGNLSTSTV